MAHAVVLYGAPGVGKDTVTASLSRLDARYRLFPRIDARWTAARLRRASPAMGSTDGIHLHPRIRPSGPGPSPLITRGPTRTFQT